ncbi:MAG TPA: hypothetical protein VGG34_09855 [Opitutaceae bacterium]
MNRIEEFSGVFAGIRPGPGGAPDGFAVDFLGTRTRRCYLDVLQGRARAMSGGAAPARLPVISDGEVWFEAVNWVQSAREASGRFVMVTLGGCYGGQASGCHRALQALNPMPCRLVVVEPEPGSFEWVKEHFRDNGIDPGQHWLLPLAMSDTNAPVFFPVGAPGYGAQNCYSTNEAAERRRYVEELLAGGPAQDALRRIVLENRTGLMRTLNSDPAARVEIKLVGAITLSDLLAPLDFVDYLESDIQQSELIVFPPFIDLLGRKVRRIHIGTHGVETHQVLLDLFAVNGWEIVFNFAPNGRYGGPWGAFDTNDGVLTVRNPRL